MKLIDFEKIEQLPNKNDAYWMDRANNVGVLKFVGEDGDVHYKGQRARHYKMNGRLAYVITHEKFKEIDFFGDVDVLASAKMRDNKAFSEFGDDCKNYRYMFIPNREKLELVANLEKCNEKVYCVHERLGTFVEKAILFEKNQYTKAFKNLDEATEYYNELKKKIFDDTEKAAAILNNLYTTFNDFLVSNGVDTHTKIKEIRARDAKFGEKYHQINLSNGYTKSTITIKYIDDDGIVHLTNNKVLLPHTELVSEEEYQKYKLKEKYGEIYDNLYKISYELRRVATVREKLKQNLKPFSSDDTSVRHIDLYDSAKDLMKKLQKCQANDSK